MPPDLPFPLKTVKDFNYAVFGRMRISGVDGIMARNIICLAKAAI